MTMTPEPDDFMRHAQRVYEHANALQNEVDQLGRSIDRIQEAEEINVRFAPATLEVLSRQTGRSNEAMPNELLDRIDLECVRHALIDEIEKRRSKAIKKRDGFKMPDLSSSAGSIGDGTDALHEAQ